MKAEIGIIGGSGLYAMPGFKAQDELHIETPFGPPSDNDQRPPLPSRDREGAGVNGAVVTLRVTDPRAAVETLRAVGLLLELIEERTP